MSARLTGTVPQPRRKSGAMITIWEECPGCKKRTGVLLLLGFTSGLGPETYVCPKCGERFPSGRTEWRSKGWVGKSIYTAMTLFYVGLLGLFGAVFTATSLRFLREGVSVPEYPLDAWLQFWPYGLPFAAAALILQGLRVRASIRRSPDGRPSDFRAAFWRLTCNPQGMTLLAMLLLPGLCWVAAFLLHRDW